MKESDKVKFDSFFFSVMCWRPAQNFLKMRAVKYKILTSTVSAGLKSRALTLRTVDSIQNEQLYYIPMISIGRTKLGQQFHSQ